MAKRKNYYFKFISKDWLTDMDLRQCSLAAQGLWINILALMQANEKKPGYLAYGSFDAFVNFLSVALGKAVEDVKPAFQELLDADMGSLNRPKTLYFSSRQKREKEMQKACSEAGKKGADRRYQNKKSAVNTRVNDDSIPHGVGDGVSHRHGDGLYNYNSNSNSNYNSQGEMQEGEWKSNDAGKRIRWNPTDGFTGITEADRRAWSEAFPDCIVDRQLANAHLWLDADHTQAKKYSSWPRFLRNWMQRSQEAGGDKETHNKGGRIMKGEIIG